MSNGLEVNIKDLHKSFTRSNLTLDIIKGLELNILSGESLAILGASGVGKSTLLNLIGTLDHPTSGQIEMDGRDIVAESEGEKSRFRNMNIGFVFQFHNLLKDFTAVENVAMPLLIRRRSSEQAYEKAKQLLVDVGLENRISHKPGELSGGEQQRVAVARALINEPRMLLADEPTGNLDSKSSQHVFDLLVSMVEERSSTLIVVTHNEHFAKSMARCVWMKDGKVFSDSPDN